MPNNINQLVRQHYAEIVDLRRYFHTYPEVSAQEYKTQEKIIAELTKLGLPAKKAAGTGVVAEVTGKATGPVVAIRADIDALPLQDECDAPYRSKNPGVCHACGHDGHMAMLLGAAKVLTAMRDSFSGTVRLLFQPSEEYYPGGAEKLISEGALDTVSAVIGAHLWQPLQVGTVGLNFGKLMAAPDEFMITIKGRGGHGSMPHQTIDPLLVGAQLVVALNTIISRNIDPVEPAALSLGMFKAGEIFNIIPDTAVLKGTVRTFEQSVRENIFSRIEQITKGICQAAGAQYEIEDIFGYPPVVNNPAVAAVLKQAGQEVLGQDGVLEVNPVLAGEDFSYYLQKAPGAFMFIGAGNPEKNIIFPQHHPKFDIDETALGYGVEIMVNAALKLLGGK
jgi:amidohydrolase